MYIYKIFKIKRGNKNWRVKGLYTPNKNKSMFYNGDVRLYGAPGQKRLSMSIYTVKTLQTRE
jgi:hypothetical protein